MFKGSKSINFYQYFKNKGIFQHKTSVVMQPISKILKIRCINCSLNILNVFERFRTCPFLGHFPGHVRSFFLLVSPNKPLLQCIPCGKPKIALERSHKESVVRWNTRNPGPIRRLKNKNRCCSCLLSCPVKTGSDTHIKRTAISISSVYRIKNLVN